MTASSFYRLSRFALVGITTTATHIMAATALWQHAWSHTLANAVAFVVATFLGYVLHTGWSFQHTRTPRNAMRYWTVAVLGTGLSAGLAWVADARDAPRWAALLATVIAVPGLSYGAHTAWTYGGQTQTPSHALPFWGVDVLGWLCLCALGLVLHGSALDGGWRWDDGTHLLRTTQYSLSDIFLRPEVMRYVSGNQIAPMNLALYWLNAKLFGLQPSLFYAVHLMSLALALGGLWVVWRLWWSIQAAWAGGVVFLLGVPSTQMMQQLMVGHYVLGLALACVAFWAIQRSWHTPHPRRAWVWAIVSAVAYAWACVCKEVYVPLILPMLLWAVSPLGTSPLAWTQRCVRAVPVFLVAVLYTLGRWWLFRGVGGYHQGSWNAEVLSHSLLAWTALLGDGGWGMLAWALLVMACGSAIVRLWVDMPQRDAVMHLIHIVVWTMAVGLPLLWIIGSRPDWQAHTRYLWMLWVLVATVWVAWASISFGGRWLAWGAFTVLMAVVSQQQWHRDTAVHALFDGYMRQASVGDAPLFPPAFNGQGYLPAVLSSAHEAVVAHEHQTAATGGHLPTLRFVYPRTLTDVPPDAWVWDADHAALRRWKEWPHATQAAYFHAHAQDGWLALPHRPPWPPIADGVTGAVAAQRLSDGTTEVSGHAPLLGGGSVAFLFGTSTLQPIQPVWEGAMPSSSDASAAHPPFSRFRFRIPSALVSLSDRPMLCLVVQSQHPGQAHRFLVLAEASTGRIASHCEGLLRP